jgi:CheY-like chemotaxis protein
MKRMRVLLVDDDPRVLERHEALLSPHHEIVKAIDGESALEVLAQGGVHAVISDYAMPGMTGTELLQHVHLRSPRVRRVLCSNAPPASSAQLVRDGVIAVVLKKPASLAQLLAALG